MFNDIDEFNPMRQFEEIDNLVRTALNPFPDGLPNS